MTESGSYPSLPSAPFVFTSDSDAGTAMRARSSRESIQRLARVLRFYHQNHAQSPDTPLLFSADYAFAPELIAACWHAGRSFLVMPPGHDSAAEFEEEMRCYSDLLPYDWQAAIAEYLEALPADPVAAKEFEAGLLPDAATADATKEEQVFMYAQTSGSSGRPKLIALKRRQFVAAADQAGTNMMPPRDGCWLLCLPLHHIGGISVVLRSWLYGSPVLDLRKADMEDIAGHIRHNEAVSMASMVPTQLHQLMKVAREKRHEVVAHPHFQAVLLGGGPSDAGLIEAARARKLPVMKSYGMTETCAQIFATPADELFTAPPESSGKLLGTPAQGYEAVIRPPDSSADDAAIPYGETGLLWLRGPQIIGPSSIIRAADAPPETASAALFDAEGWFCTGDYARLDADGYLFIEMRRSDLIVSGGKNINPARVENAIRRAFPQLKDCSVTGAEDSYWGQRPVAFLVAGSAEAEKLLTTEVFVQKLREQLPAYMIPREIRFLPSLPRTALGKLKKNELK